MTRITEKAKLKRDDNKKLKKRLITEKNKKKNKSILEKINKLGTSKSQKSTTEENKYGIKISTENAITTQEAQSKYSSRKKTPKSNKKKTKTQSSKERKSSKKRKNSTQKNKNNDKQSQDHFKILVSKKRKISLLHGEKSSKKKEIAEVKVNETETIVNDSKISSSFKASLDSKNNNILGDLNGKKISPILNQEVRNPVQEKKEESKIEEEKLDDEIEKQRQNEMELTDKPLKSNFLFKGLDSIPLNCSEKDSITYKIGNYFCFFVLVNENYFN